MATKRIFLTALIASFLGACVWLMLRPREPNYYGKPLSYWVQVYDPSTGIGAESNTADGLLGQLGTNIIPTLLQMIRAKDSALKLRLVGLIQKQTFIRIRYIPASERNKAAVNGFERLGGTAAVAAPALVEIYEQNISPSSQRAVINTLAFLGPAAKEAVPLLVKATGNANVEVRCEAIRGFRLIPSNPELVVPALVASLHDADASVRQNAATTLACFGSDAKPSVPRLIEALKDQDPNVRSQAERTLKRIDARTIPEGR